MDERYHEGSRELQDRFDTRRLADRIDERTAHDHIRPEDRAFIERMDMFFLATSDLSGQPQCSYKGGDPGFVRVLDGCGIDHRGAPSVRAAQVVVRASVRWTPR